MSNSSRLKTSSVVGLALILGLATFSFVRPQAAGGPSPHPLRLRGGDRYLTAAEGETSFKAATQPRGGIVQFASLPTEAQIESLKLLGVDLQSYLPDNAYIASIPGGITFAQLETHGVDWAGELTANEKIAEALTVVGTTPDWCRGSDGLPRFSIGVISHDDLKTVEQWMSAEYGAQVIGTSQLSHSIEVALPAENWQEIAADPRVLWLEPFWPRETNNNSNRTNVGADIAQAVPYSLSGNGIVVGEWDEGRADPNHADFGGRIISADASAISTHATHVAGTVLGAGAAPSFTYKGMAPQAAILSHQWWFSASEMETEYSNAIDNVGMRISTNSWGLGVGTPSVALCNATLGNYFSECRNLDDVVRGKLGQPVNIIWSAGNQRSTNSASCGSVGMTWGTVSPYGTAKNLLTIGAINSNNSTMTGFSSWGPTDDGRLKPELVGPGCQSNGDFGVTSTKPGSGYTVFCGTSMSAPTVSGCVALLMERVNSMAMDPPLPSSVKAIFVESADELGDPGPEFDWGYGRVDVVAAIDLFDQGRFLEDQITHGDTKSWTFVNNGTLSMVSVTLAWDDPGATVVSGVTLVNNLDIRLIPPSGPAEYLPWVLDPANPALSATTGVDSRNNLEQVRRSSGLEVGTWTVEVTGTNVPIGPQKFSLAFAPGMSLTSTNQPFAVSIQAEPGNQFSPVGVAPLAFELSNAGFNNDTYDVTLTSAKGWSIASNPMVIALNGNSDSALTFDLTIPPGTSHGTVDTIVALAESQSSPGTSSNTTLYLTVVSGRAVSVQDVNDTLGVPGKTISITARVTNTGIAADTFDWDATNDNFWTITPPSGSVPIPQGDFADVMFDVVIPSGAVPGASNPISFIAVSQDDPSALGVSFFSVGVIDHPPVAVPASPVNTSSTNNSTPTLEWTHNAFTPPPPGFDDFSYYVDLASDPSFTVSPTRNGPIADTFFTPSAMPDGVYYWRILTVNPVGDTSALSSVNSFTIDTEAPLAPSLTLPVDNAYEPDTTVTFTWELIPDAAQYKWEIATDPGFTTDLDSAWIGSPTHDLQVASCSTVVYWRVSAIDDAGNLSAPSVTRSYAVYQVGDINFDCVLNVVDVVGIVGIAFRGDPLPSPPGRAELMCNPPTDITDVVRMIEIVFRGGSPPCGPS